jgi:hypothetical protein
MLLPKRNHISIYKCIYQNRTELTKQTIYYFTHHSWFSVGHVAKLEGNKIRTEQLRA